MEYKKQCDYYGECINNIKTNPQMDGIYSFVTRSLGLSDDDMKREFLGNTKNFQSVVVTICHEYQKGNISPATYAGVVAYIASRFCELYTVNVGIGFPAKYRGTEQYERDVKYLAKKSRNGEHPMYPNIVWLEIAGKKYYNLGGDTSDVEIKDAQVI